MFELFQPEEESERDESVAADLVVVDETAGRQSKNGGKGQKRPSLAVSGRCRAAKQAREPAVLEVNIGGKLRIRKCRTVIARLVIRF